MSTKPFTSSVEARLDRLHEAILKADIGWRKEISELGLLPQSRRAAERFRPVLEMEDHVFVDACLCYEVDSVGRPARQSASPCIGVEIRVVTESLCAVAQGYLAPVEEFEPLEILPLRDLRVVNVYGPGEAEGGDYSLGLIFPGRHEMYFPTFPEGASPRTKADLEKLRARLLRSLQR